MKKICFPTVCERCEKNILKYENTAVAYILFNTPEFEGETKTCKKIGAFYKRMADSFKKWTESEFNEYVINDYTKDPNKRKKYRYVPFYLEFIIHAHKQDENTLIINTVIILKKKNMIISEKSITHKWNVKTGVLSNKKHEGIRS